MLAHSAIKCNSPKPPKIVTKSLALFLLRKKVNVKFSPLRPWRPMGDRDARVHIFAATALVRGRMAIPTLGYLYPGKIPVLILHQA